VTALVYIPMLDQHLMLESEKTFITAFYWQGMDLQLQKTVLPLPTASVSATVVCTTLLTRLVHMGYYSPRWSGTYYTGLSRTEKPRVVATQPLILPAIFGFLMMLLSAGYIVALITSRGTIMSKRCFFMPCAPQPISEWDQSFALFTGLAMFAYEFRSTILKRCERWLRQRHGSRGVTLTDLEGSHHHLLASHGRDRSLDIFGDLSAWHLSSQGTL
jgi:hypothetical protein